MKYNWQWTICMLKLQFNYFLLYVYTHKIITTSRQWTYAPKVPLCPFVLSLCLFSSPLFSWPSQTYILMGLESRSGALSLGSMIPIQSLFFLWLYTFAQNQETFSLSEGLMRGGSLVLIHHVFPQICGLCCKGFAYRSTEGRKGPFFSFLLSDDFSEAMIQMHVAQLTDRWVKEGGEREK